MKKKPCLTVDTKMDINSSLPVLHINHNFINKQFINKYYQDKDFWVKLLTILYLMVECSVYNMIETIFYKYNPGNDYILIYLSFSLYHRYTITFIGSILISTNQIEDIFYLSNNNQNNQNIQLFHQFCYYKNISLQIQIYIGIMFSLFLLFYSRIHYVYLFSYYIIKMGIHKKINHTFSN